MLSRSPRQPSITMGPLAAPNPGARRPPSSAAAGGVAPEQAPASRPQERDELGRTNHVLLAAAVAADLERLVVGDHVGDLRARQRGERGEQPLLAAVATESQR